MSDPALTFSDILSTYWPIFVCSLAVSLVATPACRALALRRGVVDKPDDWLKPHKKPVPYLGGVAIFFGWAAGIALALALFDGASATSPPATHAPTMHRPVMLGILVAGAAIMLIGLRDDLRGLSPKMKLAGNIAVALVLVWLGVGHDVILVLTRTIHVELASWLVLAASVPMTIFIVVGACNATNLIDGVDGLCSGVLGIISVGFLVLAVHLHVWNDWQPLDAQRVVLALAMLGAALGFLPFNRSPAKIFMGDAGSMLLGLNAAILLLLFARQETIRWAMGSVMVFGLPIADMLLTLARRWRNQRPLMQGDRSHFYDQLLDRGMPVRRVVAISYALAALFAAIGCATIFVRVRYAIPLYLLVVVAVAAAIGAAGMVRIQRRRAAPVAGAPMDILFTSVGRRVSLIREFRRAALDLGINLRIHAADVQPMAPALQIVDRRLIVPSVGADDYCDGLRSYCNNHGIIALIPLIDPELQTLADARESFAKAGTRVIISSPEVVHLCMDKARTHQFLLERGFLSPKLLTDNELAAPDYPLFIKPSDGSSSLGAHKINTPDDLAYYRKLDPESMIQQFIEGVEYTVDVFVDFDGRPRCAVPRRRHEVRGGEVSKGQAIRHTRMMQEHCRLVEALGGCLGMITIQCFLTPDDRIVFIEVNPRFGGGVPLSIRAGADSPRWMLELLMGREPDISMDRWTDGLFMLRFDEGVFARPEELVQTTPTAQHT